MDVATQKIVCRLDRLCRRWSGSLRVIDLAEFERFDSLGYTRLLEEHGIIVSPSARGHAVDYKNKLVIVAKPQLEIGSIIHEMGHIFACDKGPDDSDEFSWLGWEIATARYVGAYRIWDVQNVLYGVGDWEDIGGEWGQLEHASKRRLIANRLKAAYKFKLVDAEFRPLAIR